MSTSRNTGTNHKGKTVQTFNFVTFFVYISSQGWDIHRTPSTIITITFERVFYNFATPDLLDAHGTPSESSRISSTANFLSMLGVAEQHRAKFAFHFQCIFHTYFQLLSSHNFILFMEPKTSSKSQHSIGSYLQ